MGDFAYSVPPATASSSYPPGAACDDDDVHGALMMLGGHAGSNHGCGYPRPSHASRSSIVPHFRPVSGPASSQFLHSMASQRPAGAAAAAVAASGSSAGRGSGSSNDSNGFDYMPPGSSSGVPGAGSVASAGAANAPGPSTPASSHHPAVHANDYAAYPHAPATASGSGSNLWGYSIPSPPQTAQSVASTAYPPGTADGPVGSLGLHGYNVSNTRPMTAPTGMTHPTYYHGPHFGGIFSPATYTGAGFPQSFASRTIPIATDGAVHPDPSRSSSLFAHGRPSTATSDYPGAHENTDDWRRPGTSETVRPDTAVSAYSSYSGGAPPAPAFMHPTLYNTGDGLPHPSIKSDPNASQQRYNFVALPSQPKKRPRRRFEEIERLYDCSYPGCNKAYGTLNHLNAHVSMQKHGPKRLPAEFKEIRKAWRQRKKESEAAAKAREAEARRGNLINAPTMHAGLQHNPGGPHLPSISTSVIKQQSTVTPPSSSSVASAPIFPSMGAFHGYYGSSPGGYARPSTAPSHVAHTYSSQVSPLTGLPPSYLLERKASLTSGSLPPSFAAIEEEPAGEHNGPVDPLKSHIQANGHSAGRPPSSPERPSTSGSPFQYNASSSNSFGGPGFGSSHEDRRLSEPNYGGFGESSHGWHADWKNLNAPSAPYQREIQH